MPDSGPNRVLVGLPDRLAKADDRIAILEERMSMIRQIVNEPADSDRKLATINQICLGKYDSR